MWWLAKGGGAAAAVGAGGALRDGGVWLSSLCVSSLISGLSLGVVTRRRRLAGAECCSRRSQGRLNIHFERVGATEHAPSDPFHGRGRRAGAVRLPRAAVRWGTKGGGAVETVGAGEAVCDGSLRIILCVVIFGYEPRRCYSSGAFRGRGVLLAPLAGTPQYSLREGGCHRARAERPVPRPRASSQPRGDRRAWRLR